MKKIYKLGEGTISNFEIIRDQHNVMVDDLNELIDEVDTIVNYDLKKLDKKDIIINMLNQLRDKIYEIEEEGWGSTFDMMVNYNLDDYDEDMLCLSNNIEIKMVEDDYELQENEYDSYCDVCCKISDEVVSYGDEDLTYHVYTRECMEKFGKYVKEYIEGYEDYPDQFFMYC